MSTIVPQTTIAERIAQQYPAYVDSNGLVGRQELDGTLVAQVEASAKFWLPRAEGAEMSAAAWQQRALLAEGKVAALELGLAVQADTAITYLQQRDETQALLNIVDERHTADIARLLDERAALVAQREDLLLTRSTQAEIIGNLRAERDDLRGLILALASCPSDADDPGVLVATERVVQRLRETAQRLRNGGA